MNKSRHIFVSTGIFLCCNELTRNKLRRLIKKLKEQGLGGLEVWHSSHSSYQVQAFERLCKEFDLIATGGSDFHGTLTPDLSLGRGFGTLHVPDSVLTALFAQIRQ